MNHLNLPGLEEALEDVEFFERDRTESVVVELATGLYNSGVSLRKTERVLGWTGIERSHVTVWNYCGLGPVRARGRVHARVQVFLRLCLRVVVAITNDERGDNPGRAILTA